MRLCGDNKYFITVDDFATKNEDLIKKHYFVMKKEDDDIAPDTRSYLLLREYQLKQKTGRNSKKVF